MRELQVSSLSRVTMSEADLGEVHGASLGSLRDGKGCWHESPNAFVMLSGP